MLFASDRLKVDSPKITMVIQVICIGVTHSDHLFLNVIVVVRNRRREGVALIVALSCFRTKCSFFMNQHELLRGFSKRKEANSSKIY